MAFDRVRVVLGMTNGPMRSAIKGALHAKGFRALTEVSDLVGTHAALEQDMADLLITTTKMGVEEITPLLREVRRQNLGTNPFLVAIMLLESPSKEELSQVINAGADDVLLMPMSSGQLMDRVDTLSKTRKPFVYTYDYVGPDRRKGDRPGAAPALTYDAPNPLKLRIDPVIDDARYAGLIRNGLVIHRRYMIGVSARQGEWLAAQAALGCRDEQVPLKETVGHLVRLLSLSETLAKRLEPFEDVDNIQLSKDLHAVTSKVSADPRTATMEILGQMTNAAKLLRTRLSAPLERQLAASLSASAIKTW